MPMISVERKNEIAQLFMDRRPDLYRKSYSKEPFENLTEHLYHRGFILDKKTGQMIQTTARNLDMTIIEATDFFREVISEVSELISKNARCIGK